MSEFTDFLQVLENDEFDEKPVPLDEFLYSEDYLNLPPLSEQQTKLLEAMTQIYRFDTLVDLWGEEEAQRLWASTKQEIIFMLGKGCHAPSTPVYSPTSGKWERLDSRKSDGVALSDDHKFHYSTEAFVEGYGEMVRVKTSMGLEEDVYVGHKYLSSRRSDFYKRVERGFNPEYMRVDELMPGDRIAVAIGFDVEDPKNIPTEHAELIGYWLGDGMMPADHNPVMNVDFCADEEESIARYEELCAFIGDNPKKYYHKTKNLVFFRHGARSNAVKIAKEYGLWGARAKTKKIPDAVWASSNKVLAACISRLWQSDGCVYYKTTRPGGGQFAAEICSVSKQLAVDVQRALLRLGVPSTIRFRTPKSNFDNASEAGYITVSGYENIDRFAGAIELLDHKKINNLHEGRRAWKRIEGNHYYDKIVSIEPLGEDYYWTFSVPDTGNYVGNGMVSAQSGKDFVTSVGFARVAYLLLCLKDPAAYFGKPPGDTIAMLNVAINAKQAKNVFFRYFKQRIKLCSWFDGKYDTTQDSITFDKNIEAHSGHSEREAWEGYNFIVVVLDEISGFATEAESTNDGGGREKTADAIYRMYRASVSSRFPKYGKLLLLSFPRYKNDYIQTRYNAAVAEKHVVNREHKFKIHEDLPDGIESNEFKITWEQDEIISYTEDGVYALKRPTWEVNPTIDINDLKGDFLRNKEDALSRFACAPPESIDSFFKDRSKIEEAFPSSVPGPFREDWSWRKEFQPDKEKSYYIHVDLAYKHDRAAVAMSSVDKWVTVSYGQGISHTAPMIRVDAIRYWTPTSSENVNLEEVKDFIVQLKRIGFPISLVTFDSWNSVGYRQQLKSDFGIDTDLLSVAKPHYEDFSLALQESRIRGYNSPLLVDELVGLKIIKGNKVDHTRKGSKDVADAVVGSVYNAINNERQGRVPEIEIFLGAPEREEDAPLPEEEVQKPGKIPKDLEEYLSRMQLI